MRYTFIDSALTLPTYVDRQWYLIVSDLTQNP